MSENTSSITSFVNPGLSEDSSDIWAVIEEEEVFESEETATLADAYSMLAMARAGESARGYLYDECAYAKIVEGTVTITLPFYVWVSAMDLPYTLTSDLGEVDAGTIVHRPRSFDVIFDNTDEVDVGFLFEGNLTPEMPFFDLLGNKIGAPEITTAGSKIKLSSAATCVLRANITAAGYSHTLSVVLAPMAVTNTDEETGETTALVGYSLDSSTVSVTVSWVDGNGDIQTNVEDLTIPGCVTSLLDTCNEETLPDLSLSNDDDEADYLVYFSTCNGVVLDEYWKAVDK